MGRYCPQVCCGLRLHALHCTAREEEGSIVVDITWADGHSAIGLPVAAVLPRTPFSRALMQVRMDARVSSMKPPTNLEDCVCHRECIPCNLLQCSITKLEKKQDGAICSLLRMVC